MMRYVTQLGLGRIVSLAGLVLVACRVAPVGATSFSWNVDTGGAFDDSANWDQKGVIDLDGIPDANDVVTFRRGNGVTYTVNFPGVHGTTPVDYVTDRLLVGSNTTSFADALFGAASTYTAVNTTTAESGRGIIIGVVGGDSAAVLTSRLPTFSGAAATIGDAAGSSGTLNVTGGVFNVTGSSSPDDEFIVGNHGNGTLNVSGGADVNVSGASGDSVVAKYLGSSVTVTVSGSGSTWHSGVALYVGQSGTGTLHIANGGQVESGSTFIAKAGGSTGTATVDGSGSIWTIGGDSYVGYLGTGNLEITNGGSVADTNGNIGWLGGMGVFGTGEVTITGTNSIWDNSGDVNVGLLGAGSLHVTAGGQLKSHNADILGPVNVSGAGSKWTTSTLTVERNLSIDSGGQLSSVQTALGTNPFMIATVNVDGTNSVWTNSGTLDLGADSARTGNLNITNGGRATAFFVYIGAAAGSIGSIDVDGAGSTFVAQFAGVENLFVGYDGTGAFNITNGGQATTVGAKAYIGYGTTGSGSVTVDGASSSWSISGPLSIVRGTLVASNGGSVSVGGLLTVGSEGTVKGNGTITGNISNGGLVAPGTSPSALHISGNYTQIAAGKLQIELAGNTRGTGCDQLLVSGGITLDGTLDVSLERFHFSCVGSRSVGSSFGTRIP
jgi:T5SS/PEP-CTERM-associated repeat protein